MLRATDGMYKIRAYIRRDDFRRMTKHNKMYKYKPIEYIIYVHVTVYNFNKFHIKY